MSGQSNTSKVLAANADSIYNLGLSDTAAVLYGKAMDVSKKEINWKVYYSALIGLAYCYQDAGRLKDATNLLKVELGAAEKNEDIPAFEYAKTFVIYGLMLRLQEDYLGAIGSYEQSIRLFDEAKINHHYFAFACRNIATIYERRLDYEKAIMYLQKAIEVDSMMTYATSIYIETANCYFFLKNYGDSKKYADFAFSSAIDAKEKAFVNGMIANIQFELGYYEESERHARDAIKYFERHIYYWENCVKMYSLLGSINENVADKTNALKSYMKGINHAKRSAESKNREVCRIHFDFGGYFQHQNLLDSALSHYQQALIQVFPKFNSTNIADNPELKDVYTESWIMTAAARKAEALRQRYQQKGDVADLHNAAYCFDLSLAAVKQLHKSYGSENAKLYMGDYSHTYFEEAIEVNYLLYTLTGDQTKLQKIFALMEESKASVLSEAIQKNKALLLEGIPDSLLEQEQDFRITIADLITQQKNTKVEGQDAAAELDKLNSLLSETQLKYERLIEKMKEDYPQFRNYVEELPMPSFGDVSSRLLDDKSLFVEYFWGEKALYCLSIGRNGANIFKVERKAEFNDLIQQYLAFFKDANAILDDPDCYLSTAHELYQALFAKVLNAANAHATNIMVVPDGLLGYLPFDALVTSFKGSTTSFGKVDFLIKKHGLHYGYSANVLLQQLENHREKGQLLRVMPRFAAGERGLSPLEYSDEETAGVRSWQSLDGQLATKASFLQMASKCRLIHLSTHAESNSGQGEPHIELADGQLMLPELYAMNLSAADLVVLSACETGLGKLEKGEGVMSLARGFAYAGANSLVASLWKVNERSTATLFAHFYQYLGEGKTKSEALRLAKLSTLENAESDIRQSPYYWAGFVFMGNDGEMDLPTGLPIGRIAVPLVVASLAGGIFYLRKRRRRLIA